jgi:hypothetical protein
LAASKIFDTRCRKILQLQQDETSNEDGLGKPTMLKICLSMFKCRVKGSHFLVHLFIPLVHNLKPFRDSEALTDELLFAKGTFSGY